MERLTAIALTLGALLVAGGTLHAQTPLPSTGSAKLAWDQFASTGLSAADALAQVLAFEYRLYVDGKPQVLPKQTCTTSLVGITCEAPLPALTVGVHTLELAAVDIKTDPANPAESPKAEPLLVRFYVAPMRPIGFRLVVTVP